MYRRYGQPNIAQNELPRAIRAKDMALPPRRRMSRLRAWSLVLLVVGCSAAVVLGVYIGTNRGKGQTDALTDPSARLRQQQLPPPTISEELGSASTTSSGSTR